MGDLGERKESSPDFKEESKKKPKTKKQPT